MIKGVTYVHLGPIWYHSEPSDVPFFPNQFLGWDFFAVSYSKPALVDFTKQVGQAVPFISLKWAIIDQRK